MEIFTYTLQKNPFPNNAYMNEISQRNFCFLDIETTGFSRKKNQIVLIGLLYIEGDHYRLRQYFLEDPNQEKNLLNHFIKDLSEFELMVTYNGLSFDYPFIQERASSHHLSLHLNKLKHIDLYKHIQVNKKILPVENYRLKTIETLLGIHRKDQISGGDSILLYHQYQRSKQTELRDQILLHNYEDILYLPLITEVFNFFSQEVFLVNSIHNSIRLTTVNENILEELTFTIKLHDLKVQNYRIIINGSTKTLGTFQEINLFEDQFNFFWNPNKEKYQLEILMNTETLDSDTIVHFFNPAKVFSFLSQNGNRVLVDNNIIMSVNSVIDRYTALKILPEILEQLYRNFLQ